jgi:hypothetical protein
MSVKSETPGLRLGWDYKMIWMGHDPSTPRFKELTQQGWGVASSDRGWTLLRRIRVIEDV